MFSDNILKLINSSVYYNHTLNLTNAFLTLPLTSSCTVILFDVTDYIDLFENRFVFIVVLLFFFIFSCTPAVKSAAADNNYIRRNQEKRQKKKKRKKEIKERKKNRASHTHTHICTMYSMNMLKMTMQMTWCWLDLKLIPSDHELGVLPCADICFVLNVYLALCCAYSHPSPLHN